MNTRSLVQSDASYNYKEHAYLSSRTQILVALLYATSVINCEFTTRYASFFLRSYENHVDTDVICAFHILRVRMDNWFSIIPCPQIQIYFKRFTPKHQSALQKMVDIAVVRSGIYDARIVKVIRSLSKQHSAVFLGWNREGIGDEIRKEMLQKNFHNNLHLSFKILNMKAPFARQLLRCYIPMILYFPLFWTWVFVNLAIFRPRVVHAFDLDTVLPCYIYKKLFRKKLVFDIADRYAMTFIPKKHHMLYSTLNSFEEAFSKRADVLITLAENVLESFRKKPNKTAVILNCPEDYSSNKGITEDGIFVLGYGGPISKGRGLEYIATALSNLSKVKLYVYGPIIDKELFGTINRLSNVEYKGLLRIYDDYHKTIVLTDTIIAIYTKETPSHHITMHNKHLEAMMGGIPIITNLSPEFVNEIDFGIIVEYGNIDQIRSAITRLRDDSELRKRLGNNGRKAFLEKYNWGIMEKKLYDVYDNLL